jgi:hypothetical protein
LEWQNRCHPHDAQAREYSMNNHNPEDYFFFTTAFPNFSIMPGASWPVAAESFSRVGPEI